MEGHLIDATKMHEGYTGRSTRHVTKKCTSYMWNVTGNLDLVKNSSTPWCGAVDQDWRSKMHVLKCASQPPERSMLTLLRVSSWSGKGAP